MDLDCIKLSDPPESNEKATDDERGNWHKRLRFKKASAPPLTVQSADKDDRKLMDQEKEQMALQAFKRPPQNGHEHQQTVPQSFNEPTPNGHQHQQVAGVSRNVLRFICSECKDSMSFSPNDLVKHFQRVHKGSQPSFPCDMCSFVTHEFSCLHRHRMGHRKTLVTCDICNDNVQHTLLQLTRHCNLFHSLKGQYRCEKCKFSTKDIGTFVQHTHQHNTEWHKGCNVDGVRPTGGELMRHLSADTAVFPYSAQSCDYGPPQKDTTMKHNATVHSEGIGRRYVWKKREVGPKMHNNKSLPGLKHLLTSGLSREAHWMSQGLLPFSGGGLLDEKIGILFQNPEKTLEETQQFLERTVAADNSGMKRTMSLKAEEQHAGISHTTPSHPKSERCSTPHTSFHNRSSNNLMVFMKKNNISIPPSCTTKVVGFKMVDGKKHLVLKVIPSAKQEVSPETVRSPPSTTEKESNGVALESQTGNLNASACAEEDQSNSDVSAENSSICSPGVLLASDAAALASVQAEGQEHGPCQEQSEGQRVAVDPERGDIEKNELFESRDHGNTMGSNAQLTETKKLNERKFSTEKSSEEQIVSFEAFPSSESIHPIDGEADLASQTISMETSQPIGEISSPDSSNECLNTQELIYTKQHEDRQEKAFRQSEVNSTPNSTSQDVSGVHSVVMEISSAPSDKLLREEQSNSQTMANVSEKDNIPITNTDKEKTLPASPNRREENNKGQDAAEDTTATHQSLSDLNEHPPHNKAEVDTCQSTVVEEDYILETDGIDPASASPLKHTTESGFTSPSQDGSLLFNDDNYEHINTNDLGESPITAVRDFTANTKEVANDYGMATSQGKPHSTENLCQTAGEHPEAITHKPDGQMVNTATPADVSTCPTINTRVLQPLTFTQGTTNLPLDSTHTPGIVSHLNLISSDGIPLAAGSPQGLWICLSPQQNEQEMNRKRQRKPSAEDCQEPMTKSRKCLSEKSKACRWEPVPRDAERTLRLLPLRSTQVTKSPQRYQPVVVLNHPDMDIPEVTNIMSVVHKHKGEVQRVVLSRGTMDALSEFNCDTFRKNATANCHASHCGRAWPQGTVRERFILNLKLKKFSRNKYRVMPSTSKSNGWLPKFSCWFCGRVFNNQEVWVGHGQRHLMEATRDWNMLFKSNGYSLQSQVNA